MTEFYAKNWKYDSTLEWAYKNGESWGNTWDFDVKLQEFDPCTAYSKAKCILSDTVASQAFPWDVTEYDHKIRASGDFNRGGVAITVSQMSPGMAEMIKYNFHKKMVSDSLVPEFQSVVDSGIFKKDMDVTSLMNLKTLDGETFVEFIKRDIAETPASSIVCTTPAQRIADMLVANGHIDLVKDEALTPCMCCSFYEGTCKVCAGTKKRVDLKIPARL